MARFEHFQNEQMGYLNLQGTRPLTVQQGLHDSPTGQLAWIAEKFKEWSDGAAELPEDAVGRNRLLTNVSLYWFTGTAGSSANLYYETFHDPAAFAPSPRGIVPTAVAVALTADVAIRMLAERDHHVVRWTEFERGGHFLAMEAPEQFSADVRARSSASCDDTGTTWHRPRATCSGRVPEPHNAGPATPPRTHRPIRPAGRRGPGRVAGAGAVPAVLRAVEPDRRVRTG